MGSHLRFSLAVALLGATALLLHARVKNEIIPARETFESFPLQLGAWEGNDVSIPPDVLAVLGPGDFLLRNYWNATKAPAVNLFVAYFPSQRAGDTIHSPKNCLPGGGWFPLESNKIQISLPGRSSFPVNRYLIALGNRRELVLYWYWAHNRAVASEEWAKFYLMADSIRLNRTDGSLIRVTTELRPQESTEAAQDRLLSLLRQAVPALDPYIPR